MVDMYAINTYYVANCYCLYDIELEELLLLKLCWFVLIETTLLVLVSVAVVIGYGLLCCRRMC